VSLAREEIAERVEALRHAGGGWGDKPNLRDTRRALSLLAACGQCAFREETRRFVDAMQASSFGFTATSDSSYARLDTVHAGVHACVLLGLPLRHGADALDFVLACQSSEGGFAHTPDALPDIALTHRALSVLSMLGLPGTPIPAAGAEG
jgi:prenyltransferase beta subunit